MKRNEFIKCAKALRDYSSWERKMYECGFDLASTPVTSVLDAFAQCMCDFNSDWFYDTKLELDWLIEWSFGMNDGMLHQERHGHTFNLTEPSALYDFLVFMNEHGWED